MAAGCAVLAVTGSLFWLVWVFACGIALGVLIAVGVWLSGSRLVQRIVALADLADAIGRSEQAGQDNGDEQEGTGP